MPVNTKTSALCLIGADILLEHLQRLTDQIDGVRNHYRDDIEYVHQTRVATRRLRSVLPLFADCLPGKTAKRWRKRMRAVTKALGEARDADVQIEAVRKFDEKAADDERAGVERLLLRLEQRRERIQPAVVEALNELEASTLIEEMQQTLTALRSKAKKKGGETPSQYAYRHVHDEVTIRLDELLVYETYVHRPECAEELHQMRIAAKRLRYTMEAFAPLYAGALDSSIKTVKKIQSLLGDVHDCDVWVDYVPQFLEEERTRTVEYFGDDAAMDALYAGFEALRQNRRGFRQQQYEAFVQFWEEAVRDDAWERLRAVLSAPLEIVTVALIGDVHANLPALEAVLADARERGARLIWNVGDYVGYGPFPDETVRRLRNVEAVGILGNFDRDVLANKSKKVPEKHETVRWSNDQLSKKSRAYLKSLPRQRRLTMAGKRILLVHGSPDSIKEYLRPETPESRLREVAASADADVIISGHAHEPFVHDVAGVLFINTGSVGRPDDGDPRATYAILRVTPETLQVEHHRVEYDVQATIDALRAHELPDEFSKMFQQGRSFDDVTIVSDDEHGSE